MLQSCRLFRPLCRSPLPRQFQRGIHRKTAHFVTRNDHDGSEASRIVEISIGEAHESFVLIDKQIGDELRAAASAAGAETLPLTFHHDSRHFACGKLLFPRLVLPQPLRVPARSNGEESAATLCAMTAADLIVLDGTPDHYLARMSQDAFRRLGPVFDQLKDR